MDAHMPAVFQAIDRVEKNAAATREMLTEILDPSTMNAVMRLTDPDYRSELRGKVADASHFGATLGALNDMGLGDWIDFDPTIVRGLAYYTGTVFELFDAQKTLRAICGGGRYDTLLASLGGNDLPALGFGMGDVVLGELLKDRRLHPAVPASIDIFVASVTADDVPHVLKLAHELRNAGIRVEYAMNASALGKQLNLANTRGARFAVVIGPDDRARGEVQLKDLAAKTQDAVAASLLVARLSSAIARA
jgi:histidyl-tRNA synthetase